MTDRPAPTDAELERVAVKHEAFGFGRADKQGLSTHGFDPDGLRAFADELLAKWGTPPPAVAREPLTDEQIQDLLKCGNPSDDEMRLIRLGWDAARARLGIQTGEKT